MIKLENYDICVGVIYNDKDDLKLGRVKCVAPGLLDNSTIDDDNMPYIYPFNMSGYQHFSKPIAGQKVWILRNRKNYNEYWYIPYYEYIDIVEDFLAEHYENDHPEILVARHSGGMKSMMTYDDVTGFKTEINESYENLKPNGDYELKAGNGLIRVEGGKTYIGSGEDNSSYQPAVMGKNLNNMLSDLSNIFEKLSKKSIGNPYTSPLSPLFLEGKTLISNVLGTGENKILATNTNVN